MGYGYRGTLAQSSSCWFVQTSTMVFTSMFARCVAASPGSFLYTIDRFRRHGALGVCVATRDHRKHMNERDSAADEDVEDDEEWEPAPTRTELLRDAVQYLQDASAEPGTLPDSNDQQEEVRDQMC